MKSKIFTSLILSSIFILSVAGLFTVDSPTQHLKFNVTCSGSALPVCISITYQSPLMVSSFSPYVWNTNYTVRLVSTVSLTREYLNTTVFNYPVNVQFRLNNLNSTMPTVYSSPLLWRNGPFNMTQNIPVNFTFQLFMNATLSPIGPAGAYDIGFTAVH